MTTITDSQTYQVSFFDFKTEKEEKKNVFFTGLKDNFSDARYVRSTIWPKLVSEGVLESEWLEASETKKRRVYYKLSWVVENNIVYFVLHGDTFDIRFRPIIKQVDIPESKNRDKNLLNSKTEHFCECCGKDIKGKKMWFHASTDWQSLPVDLTEEQIQEQKIDSQGWFPVGPNCANKFPKNYLSTTINF